jgi:hypothetical protein
MYVCMCVTMYLHVPLCIVFRGQACVPCIDFLVYFLSLVYLLVMYLLLSVFEFVSYLKYEILCSCVNYLYEFYKCVTFPKYLKVCPSFLSL